MAGIIEWLEGHMMPCFFKTFTGKECPGCGIQRSIVALLKGEFVESFLLFPALLPFILTICLIIFNKFRPSDLSQKLMVGGAYTTVAVILINFIIKTTLK